MDYNSIVFREFTPDSVRRIEHYRQEEAERIASERLQRQTIREDDDHDSRHSSSRKSSKHDSFGPKRMPNKELAVGQTLPRVLQTKFPAELIGKPIEEIDWYYRTEYVRIRFLPRMNLPFSRLFNRSSSWSIEIKLSFDLVPHLLVTSSLHLIVFDV